LKDNADLAAAEEGGLRLGEGLYMLISDLDGARVGTIERGEQMEKRGFAGAALSHDGSELALGDVKIEATEGFDGAGALAVGFCDAATADQRQPPTSQGEEESDGVFGVVGLGIEGAREGAGGLDFAEPALAVTVLIDEGWIIDEGFIDSDDFAGRGTVDVAGGLNRFNYADGLATFELEADTLHFGEGDVGEGVDGKLGDAEGDEAIFLFVPFVGFGVLTIGGAGHVGVLPLGILREDEGECTAEAE
jgi:hypothetical protein